MINLDNISLDECILGYVSDDNSYTCIYCEKTFKIGEVFQVGDRFFDALYSVKEHIKTTHADRFEDLIYSENKYLSLTQSQLLSLFYNGFSDADIAKKLNISTSTVRHQRFSFKEKAKSAKMYLLMWETLQNNLNKKSDNTDFLPVHGGAKMVDDRYIITNEENEKILQDVFYSLDPLKLKVFSRKEKKKIAILRKISDQFKMDKEYSKKEINLILKAIYEDYATLRRYLIEYGYMDRTNDCKSYWKK